MQNVVAIIQARMGSTRLPGKMLMPLNGTPIVQWVCSRVVKSQKITQLVVAIPSTENNKPLQQFLVKEHYNVFEGSEQNVLERFYLTAKKYNATHIVRICADNPFIDPESIDHLIDFYFKNTSDYVYNHIPLNNQYPDGLGAEMISMNVLEKVYKEATLPAHKEHCFSYIKDNPTKFSVATFNPPDKELWHAEVKLDIDTEQDFEKLQKLNASIHMPAKEIVKLYLQKIKNEI